MHPMFLPWLTCCFCSAISLLDPCLYFSFFCFWIHPPSVIWPWFFFRSEIAWKNANYAQILEYLREEYELNQRFGSLDFKLKFVEVVPCIFILLYSAKVGFFIFFEFSFVLTICYCNSTTFIFFKRSSKIDGRICWSGVS